MSFFKTLENLLENVDKSAATALNTTRPHSNSNASPNSSSNLSSTSETAPKKVEDQRKKNQVLLEKKLLHEEILKQVDSTNTNQMLWNQALQTFGQVETSISQLATKMSEVTSSETPNTSSIDEWKQTLSEQILKTVQECKSKYQSLLDEYTKQNDYHRESHQRLENQVSRLLQEKVDTDSELADALQKKELQQIQLQKKLDEIIKQLKAKDMIIVDLQAHKDKALNEQLRNEKKWEEAIQQVKQDLQSQIQKTSEVEERSKDMNREMERLKNEFLREKSEWESKASQQSTQFEKENMHWQEEWNGKVEELSRLDGLLKMRENELRNKNQELQEHKQRANKVLDQKEARISELTRQLESLKQSSSGASESQIQTTSDTQQNNLEPSDDLHDVELSQEKESQLFEYQETIQMLKKQLEIDTNTFKLKIKNLEKSLENERMNASRLQEIITNLRASIEETNTRYDEDRRKWLDQLREKSNQWRQEMQDKQKLESQLEKWKQQLQQQHGNNELEQRIKVLAEHLIEKQTQMETLQSEKSALQLQLEKQLSRVNELQLISRIHTKPIASPTNVDEEMGTGEEFASTKKIKSQQFFRNLTEQGLLSSYLAQALQRIDAFSITSGRYLNHTPLLRIFLIFYFVVFHLWTFYVVNTCH